MSDVKALFPIGKTQWAKWNSPAREAFNSMMAKGYDFNTAVAEGNAVQAKHKSGGLFGALGKVAKVATGVAPVLEVAETVATVAGAHGVAKVLDKAGDIAEVATDPTTAVLGAVLKAKKGK